jgi:hypothetical protein
MLLAAAVAAWLGSSTARSSQGTLTFHATVTGTSNDAGSFHRNESGATMGTLVGCGVLKNKKATPYGRYTYIVRTGPSSIPGVKPARPDVLLLVYRYKPGSGASYTHLDVGGTFAINGHAYAGHPTSASTESVRISSDGRSGTWTEPDGFRNYPAKVMKPVPGIAFKATWHCDAVYQFHE